MAHILWENVITAGIEQVAPKRNESKTFLRENLKKEALPTLYGQFTNVKNNQ